MAQMITRHKYLKALDIVEAYHQQTRKLIDKYKAKSDMEIGEYVECVDVYMHSRDCLTRGKRYEVIDLFSQYFVIRNDNGIRRKYQFSNFQFKGLCKIVAGSKNGLPELP